MTGISTVQLSRCMVRYDRRLYMV